MERKGREEKKTKEENGRVRKRKEEEAREDKKRGGKGREEKGRDHLPVPYIIRCVT